MFGLRHDRSTLPTSASNHSTRPASPGSTPSAPASKSRAPGQVVQAEVAAGRALQQLLHLDVGLPHRELGGDVDGHQRRHRQAERAGELAADHLGDQHLHALPGGPPLDHVGAEVVGLHEPRQRPTLAQRGDVAGGGDGGQHSADNLRGRPGAAGHAGRRAAGTRASPSTTRTTATTVSPASGATSTGSAGHLRHPAQRRELQRPVRQRQQRTEEAGEHRPADEDPGQRRQPRRRSPTRATATPANTSTAGRWTSWAPSCCPTSAGVPADGRGGQPGAEPTGEEQQERGGAR